MTPNLGNDTALGTSCFRVSEFQERFTCSNAPGAVHVWQEGEPGALAFLEITKSATFE